MNLPPPPAPPTSLMASAIHSNPSAGGAENDLCSGRGFSSVPSSEWSIEVSEPQQMGKGMSTYQAYTITSSHGDQQRTHEVQRRYSDFVWLRETLAKEYLGAVVPPVPPKGYGGMGMTLANKTGKGMSVANRVMGNNKVSTFFQSRQGGMKLFLGRLAAHGELGPSNEVRMFLSAPSLEEYKKEVKARFEQRDGAKSATQRLSKWFGKKSVQVKETGFLSTSTSGSAHAPSDTSGVSEGDVGGMVPQEADPVFQDLHQKITELRSGAEQIAKRAVMLHNASEQMSMPFRQFDSVLTQVGGRPELAHLTKWLPVMATLGDQYDGAYSQVKMLAEDNVAVLDAVLEACKVREDKRYALAARRDELQRARRKQEEARQAGKADKLVSAEQSCAKAVEAFTTAREKFTAAHARTVRDLRLYSTEYPSAFDSVFILLASHQAHVTAQRHQVLQEALAHTPTGAPTQPMGGNGLGQAVPMAAPTGPAGAVGQEQAF